MCTGLIKYFALGLMRYFLLHSVQDPTEVVDGQAFEGIPIV